MEEEFDPELFLSLAPEIQERILVQNPDLIRIFSQVNSQYETLLKRKYFNIICSEGISVDEVYNAIGYKQPIMGLYYRDENDDFTTSNHLLLIRQVDPLMQDVTSTIIEILFNNVTDVIINQITRDDVNYYDNDMLITEDLLSSYNTYTHRLSCMKINPNYAKNVILSRLDKAIEYYNKRIHDSSNIDSEYKYRIIDLYMDLIMNKYAFNILDNSNLMKLQNIEQNVDDIKHDIEYLLQELRKRIIAL
jgi:hypothetical protein